MIKPSPHCSDVSPGLWDTKATGSVPHDGLRTLLCLWELSGASQT